MVAFLLTVLINVALQIAAYLLMPKPKVAKPAAAQEMDGPTAEAGREIPVLFGEMLIEDPNCLWYGDKTLREYETSA